MDRKPRITQYGKQARASIKRGVQKVERAVGTTLGSKGRNVSIAKNWGAPNIIHDGVSVAREIVLEDPFENSAAQQVIVAAQNTNNEAGDGTTTATILTRAIVEEAIEMIEAGSNPMILKKGMEAAVEVVQKELKKMTKEVKTIDDMISVATISAADKNLGEMIAKTIQKVGKGGIVTVQEGSGSTIDVEYKEGMELSNGWINPYMVTNPERMESVLEKSKQPTAQDIPFVIIVNEKLNNEQLVGLLNIAYASQKGAKVLVLADDFEPLAVQSLLINKINYGNLMVGVKSPEFGEHRTNLLGDIAVATGGVVLGGAGIALDQATVEHFGRAERVLVTRDQTIIVGGQGKKKEIQDRISGIKKEMQDSKTEFEKDKFEGRLAKLQGGVAVISVGAPSETEMRDKKERIYDAVNATKAAVDEGIVPGGGVALVRASDAIDALTLPEKEMIGARIIKEALTYPFKRLIENAGTEKADYAIGKIKENKSKNFGYNVDTEKYEDLVASGIIDPLKVTRTALEQSASVALMLITTEVLIVDQPEKPKNVNIDDEGIGGFND